MKKLSITTTKALIGLGFLASAGLAQSALLSYADRTAWSLAVAGTVVSIDFETPVAPPGGLQVTPPFVESSVSFNLQGDGRMFLVGFYHPTQVLSSQQGTQTQNFSITLPDATDGIAFDFSSFVGASSITVAFNTAGADSLSKQSVAVLAGGTGPMNFFGVTSDELFTSLTIDLIPAAGNVDLVLNIDNFAFSQRSNGIPVGGTLTLMLPALLFAGLAVRGRRLPK